MKSSFVRSIMLTVLTLQPLAGMADDEPASADPNASNRGATVDRREGIRKRTAQDRERYTMDELREIESLYQMANSQWNTPEAKESLKTLIEKYPKANRTGCAVQYMGQMSTGKDREKYLKLAIEQFGDCFYGSGVQVGAYARLYLGYYYKELGKQKDAKALFDEIRKDYPDAINHKGRRLVDNLPN